MEGQIYDRFGDGFYDYQTRSKQGNRNQGWNDSGDAIVYEAGREVDPPISTFLDWGSALAALLTILQVGGFYLVYRHNGRTVLAKQNLVGRLPRLVCIEQTFPTPVAYAYSKELNHAA